MEVWKRLYIFELHKNKRIMKELTEFIKDLHVKNDKKNTSNSHWNGFYEALRAIEIYLESQTEPLDPLRCDLMVGDVVKVGHLLQLDGVLVQIDSHLFCVVFLIDEDKINVCNRNDLTLTQRAGVQIQTK